MQRSTVGFYKPPGRAAATVASKPAEEKKTAEVFEAVTRAVERTNAALEAVKADLPFPLPPPLGEPCPVCGQFVNSQSYLCVTCRQWVGPCCRVKEYGKPPACRGCEPEGKNPLTWTPPPPEEKAPLPDPAAEKVKA